MVRSDAGFPLKRLRCLALPGGTDDRDAGCAVCLRDGRQRRGLAVARAGLHQPRARSARGEVTNRIGLVGAQRNLRIGDGSVDHPVRHVTRILQLARREVEEPRLDVEHVLGRVARRLMADDAARPGRSWSAGCCRRAPPGRRRECRRGGRRRAPAAGPAGEGGLLLGEAFGTDEVGAQLLQVDADVARRTIEHAVEFGGSEAVLGGARAPPTLGDVAVDVRLVVARLALDLLDAALGDPPAGGGQLEDLGVPLREVVENFLRERPRSPRCRCGPAATGRRGSASARRGGLPRRWCRRSSRRRRRVACRERSSDHRRRERGWR